MPLNLETVCLETGLVWPGVPTYEDWADLGPRIASVQNVSRWALADWLSLGEELFQAKADQVIGSLGLAYHTLENLRWVSRRVPQSIRQPLPVTFSHHALVASLSPLMQADLLILCRDKGWTRDEFREHLVSAELIGHERRERESRWRETDRIPLQEAIEQYLLRPMSDTELFRESSSEGYSKRMAEDLTSIVQKVLSR